MEEGYPVDGFMNPDDNKDCDVKPNILSWENFEPPHSPGKSPDTDSALINQANPQTETYSSPSSSPSETSLATYHLERQNRIQTFPKTEETSDDLSRSDASTSLDGRESRPDTPSVNSPWFENVTRSPVFSPRQNNTTDDELPPSSPHFSDSEDASGGRHSTSDSPIPVEVTSVSGDPSPSTSASESRRENNVEPIDYSTSQRATLPVDEVQVAPCVVDLTEEDDDDDISIVAMDTPVEFLYSEQRLPRRSRKRPREHTEPGPSREPNFYDLSQSSPDVVPKRPEYFNDLLRDNVVSIEEIESEPFIHHTNTDPVVTSSVPSYADAASVFAEIHTHRSSPNVTTHPFSEPTTRDVERLVAPPPPAYASRPHRTTSILNIGMPSYLPETEGFVPVGLQDGFFGSLDYFNKPHRAPIPEVSVTAVGSDRISAQNPVPSTSTGPARSGPELACPICFEAFHELKKHSESISSTICGHMFCTKCLEQSLRQAKTCPTCRKKLTKKQYHTVYLNFLG